MRRLQRAKLRLLGGLILSSLISSLTTCAQIVEAEARVGASEWIIGQVLQSNGVTSLTNTGTIWNYQRTAEQTRSHGRGSIVADASALRLGLKATANAQSRPQASLTSAFSDLTASIQDVCIATSSSVDSPTQGYARARLIIESDQSSNANIPTRQANGRIRVFSIDPNNPILNRSFTLEDMPAGELFVQIPIVISPLDAPVENFLRLDIQTRVESEGSPTVGRSLRVGLVVIWGGIESIETQPGEFLEDFLVVNPLGEDYTHARPRPDLNLRIQNNPLDSNQVDIQWVGTQDIRYHIESNTVIGNAGWSILGNSHLGNGNNVLRQPVSTSGYRFYRIRDAVLP